MATGTAGMGPTSSTSGAPPRADSRERFIETQLRKTRLQVRGVELATRLMILAAAAIAYFLGAALVDHWIVPGGLGITGRLAFLAIFLIAASVYLLRAVAPLFIYRINPLFAAHTIERAKPSLKNSLVNFLMLRSDRKAVPEVVLQAVEEQAAANLSHTPVDHVVDRSRLIHVGYVLVGVVAVFCLYFVISPKNPIETVGRVVLPWADIRPPSRVEINTIEPGTTTVFRGDEVSISAEVTGLNDDEPVTLYFTTADRQSVDQPVRMYVPKNSYRHAVTLPPESDQPASPLDRGLQQDIEYRIEAGDAISATYRLSVIQAPHIVVDKVEYQYPAYTRQPKEVVEKQGDLKAVEGTQVTIHATANQPIKSAYLDLHGASPSRKPLKVDGQHATGTVTLALNDDRTSALHDSYFVRFVSDSGHQNPEPIRYRIDVIPDASPEIQILQPEKLETIVPLNQPVKFELQASDPDYGLGEVRLVAKLGDNVAFQRNLLTAPAGKSFTGKFTQSHFEKLDKVKLAGNVALKEGDVIDYWAEAADNKSPQANVVKTEVRRLRIIAPQKPQQQEQQPDQNQQQQNDGQGEQQQNQQGGDRGKGNQDQQQNDQQQNDQRQGDQQQDQRSQQDGGAGKQNPQNNQDQKNQQRGDSQQDNRQPQNSQQNNQQQDQGGDQQNAAQDNQQKGQPDNAQPQQGDQQQRNQQQGGADSQNQRDAQGGKQRQDQQQQPGRPDQKDGEPGENNQQQGGEQQNQGAGNQEQQRQPSPVDQHDEGEAFNRILDHAREKEGRTPEEQRDQQQPDQQQPDQRPGDDPKHGEKSGPEKSGDQKNGTKKGATEKSDQPKAGQPKGGERQLGQPQGAAEKSAAEKQAQEKGAQQKGAEPQSAGDKDGQQREGETRPNQGEQHEKGAGQGGATPPPQENTKPEQQKGTGGKRSEQQPEEKTSPHGKNQSDTKGQNEGDRSGAGKEGGGQNDNRAGKGAAGQHEAADEGKSAAKEPGKGETGTEKGRDEKATGKTGQSGEEKGAGSKSRQTKGAGEGDKQAEHERADDGAQGKEPGDKRGDQKDGQQKAAGDKAGDEQGKQGDQKSDKQGQPGKGQPGEQGEPGEGKARQRSDASPEGKGTGTGGGGSEAGDAMEPPDGPRQEPGDDKANLEYARKATDLALDHLRNQLKDGEPDQELLDRLGWSKEDLETMLARWEKMQRDAQQDTPQADKAKRNLNEALQSLGLKPKVTTRRGDAKADDATRGLREAARVAPPPEYAEQYRAFQRGAAQKK